jgi:rubrerythrin
MTAPTPEEAAALACEQMAAFAAVFAGDEHSEAMRAQMTHAARLCRRVEKMEAALVDHAVTLTGVNNLRTSRPHWRCHLCGKTAEQKERIAHLRYCLLSKESPDGQ